MPEYPIPELAQKLMAMFEGNSEVYGRTTKKGILNPESGKMETKSWLQKSPVTQLLWEAHLKGEICIGSVPIRHNDTVKWAAIDIDLYKGQLSFNLLLETIETHNLPFKICRSKSGGAHLYIFFNEEISARVVIDKMKLFAGFFGQGDAEVFPKQTHIGEREDDSKYGNWINMPYDGPLSVRYGIKKDEQALTVYEFIDIIEDGKITKTQFHDLKIPVLYTDKLPDGPPCLNRIFSDADTHGRINDRNTILFNTATYLKRVFPETWDKELQKYNDYLETPLSTGELKSTVIASQNKKDYFYQCSQKALCSYCDSSECKKRKFGITDSDIDPTNKSLIKMLTEPPIYYMVNFGKEVKLTSVEFYNFDLFNRRVLEVCNRKYKYMKQLDWLDMIDIYVTVCLDVPVPEEATPQGQLKELLGIWSKAASREPNALQNNQPYLDEGGNLCFKLKDFRTFLVRMRFIKLPDNEIIAYLCNNLKGVKVRLNSLRCWKIPSTSFERDDDMEMSDIDTTTPYD